MSSATVHYIAWGGGAVEMAAPFDLGHAALRETPRYGVRRALLDAALGHVNGFPFAAVAYYVLTRSLDRRIARWALMREGYGWDGVHDCPIARTEARDE